MSLCPSSRPAGGVVTLRHPLRQAPQGARESFAPPAAGPVERFFWFLPPSSGPTAIVLTFLIPPRGGPSRSSGATWPPSRRHLRKVGNAPGCPQGDGGRVTGQKRYLPGGWGISENGVDPG